MAINKAKRAFLLERDRHACRCCTLPVAAGPFSDGRLPDNGATVDHRVARRFGGSDRADNLEIYCAFCNLLKSIFLEDPMGAPLATVHRLLRRSVANPMRLRAFLRRYSHRVPAGAVAWALAGGHPGRVVMGALVARPPGLPGWRGYRVEQAV